MRNRKYIWLIAAFISIAVGLFVIGIAFVAADFHITGFSTVTYERKVLPITEKFDRIVIDSKECDVALLPLNVVPSVPLYQDLEIDGTTAVYYDSQYITTEVRVEDGTLYITRKNQQPWYAHIGIDISDYNISLMMEDAEMESIDITTASGDVMLWTGLKGNALKVHTTSGDFSAYMQSYDTFEVQSVSGDIQLLNGIADTMRLNTTSGEISLGGITILETLQADTMSGDMELTQVAGCKNATLKTASGDIEFDSFEADDIQITTASGDVSGSLQAGKQFVCETASGDIQVPADTPNGGVCTVHTASGDIKLTVGK
jgi:DUF4097 and DUF4098 domain-containing protein YvlB